MESQEKKQAYKFLLERFREKGLLPFKKKSIRCISTEMYAKTIIETNGVQNLLTSSSVREYGVTNFDSDRLLGGQFFIATDITIQGCLNTVNPTFEKIPPILKSSELSVKQNGDLLIKMPSHSIINAQQTPNFYRSLEEYILFENMLPIEIALSFGKNNNEKEIAVAVFLKGFLFYFNR